MLMSDFTELLLFFHSDGVVAYLTEQCVLLPPVGPTLLVLLLTPGAGHRA